jgi:hypothetical protein
MSLSFLLFSTNDSNILAQVSLITTRFQSVLKNYQRHEAMFTLAGQIEKDIQEFMVMRDEMKR